MILSIHKTITPFSKKEKNTITNKLCDISHFTLLLCAAKKILSITFINHRHQCSEKHWCNTQTHKKSKTSKTATIKHELHNLSIQFNI
jgi:hypothetical protein